MKQIQEWLGHADFSTTANIYSHLDYTTKKNSANTISNVFEFINDGNVPKDEVSAEEDVSDRQELLDEIKQLKEQISKQQNDEEYIEWLKEKEKRSSKKDAEM